MSGKLPLFALGAVAVGVLTGNAIFATNPEVGEPRPVQKGVEDLLNNSSWNRVSYLAHEWWLGKVLGSVEIEDLGSSEGTRHIMFVGQLAPESVVFDGSVPTLALDWSNQTLIDVLFSHRITEDGHLIYCLEEGMSRRVFCSFNVFGQERPDSDSVVKMVGVDLGPFGVGVVETELLFRLLGEDIDRDAYGEGLSQ